MKRQVTDKYLKFVMKVSHGKMSTALNSESFPTFFLSLVCTTILCYSHKSETKLKQKLSYIHCCFNFLICFYSYFTCFTLSI